MMPRRISTSLHCLSGLPADYGGAYSDAFLIDEAGNRYDNQFIACYRTFDAVPEGDIFRDLLPGNYIPAPTVMVRTELFREVGGYDESLCYEDYDMWLRLARRCKFAFIRSPLAEYRFHANNHSRKITDWDTPNYWIYRKHIDHPEGATRFFEHANGLHASGKLPGDESADLEGVKRLLAYSDSFEGEV
jgi:hypothetical protein